MVNEEKKNLTEEELTDEMLDEVTGGYGHIPGIKFVQTERMEFGTACEHNASCDADEPECNYKGKNDFHADIHANEAGMINPRSSYWDKDK